MAKNRDLVLNPTLTGLSVIGHVIFACAGGGCAGYGGIVIAVDPGEGDPPTQGF